jgi:photosynthetic reaction center cytochrome c subunit
MRLALACAVPLFAASLSAGASHPIQSASRPAAQRTADRVYKNIQVLRQLPADDLMRTMHLMRSSLGVRCDFCHDVDQYEADAKPTKDAARRMIRMVMDLNARAFEGRTVVTCNTCHHGAVRPLAVPPIGQGLFADTTGSGLATAAGGPSAREVLARYVEALGGKTAIQSVKERVLEGVFTSAAVVKVGDAPATAVNRGRSEPVVIRVRPGGECHLTAGAGADALTLDVKDGAGIVRRQSAERRMTDREVQNLEAKLGPERALTLFDAAASMTVLPHADIHGTATVVVEHSLPDGRSELLYFEVERGLLRRSVVLSPTPVGPDPEQVDFDDYRSVEGSRCRSSSPRPSSTTTITGRRCGSPAFATLDDHATSRWLQRA